MVESLSPRLHTPVRAMARREAAVHLLSAPPESMTLVAVEPCPTCGADESTVRSTPGAVPLSLAVVVSGTPTPLLGFPIVRVHGCEMLTPRMLLAPALLRHEDGLPATFVSRSVAWASGTRSAADGPAAEPELESLLAAAEAREAVLDDCLTGPADRPPRMTGPRRTLTLPCSTRLNPAALDLPEHVVPQARFLTPHLDGAIATRLETLYRSVLVEAVAVAL